MKYYIKLLFNGLSFYYEIYQADKPDPNSFNVRQSFDTEELAKKYLKSHPALA